MKRFCCVPIMIFALVLSNELKGQSILDTLSNLYFDADLNHLDSTLVEAFKTHKNLKHFSINSIIEDSQGEHAKNEFFHKFFFEDIVVNNDSLSGNVYVETKKTTGLEKVIYLILTYDKLSEKRAISLFNYLFKIFSKYDETELRLGANAKSKYFNFNQISSGVFLHCGNKGNSSSPEYTVELALYTK